MMRSNRFPFVLVFAIMIVTIAAYGYYGKIGNNNVHDRYSELGQAFLSGHTYLDINPATGGVGDTSLYQGKYYLYFGPVPTLLPWMLVQWLTGVKLGERQLVFFFSALGTCCLIWLLATIAQNASIPQWVLPFILLPVCFGTWLPIVLRYGKFYQVSISGAYCFMAIGLLCLWYGSSDFTKHPTWWKIGASLGFGLVVGCRLFYAMDIVVLFIIWLFGLRKYNLQRNLWEGLTLAMPWTLCIAGLACYNYERFGSIFETGYAYSVDGPDSYHLHYIHSGVLEWRLANIPAHFYTYFLTPLPLSKLLPWNSDFGVVTLLKYPYDQEGYAYGLWHNSPFSLWSLWFLLNLRTCRTWLGSAYGFVIGAVIATLGLTLFVLGYQYIAARYMVDFSPWVMFVAVLGYIQALQTSSGRYRWAVLMSGGFMALWSVYVGLANAYCGYSPCIGP